MRKRFVVERRAHRAEGVAEIPRAVNRTQPLAASAVDVGGAAVGEDLAERGGEILGVRRRAVADQHAVGVGVGRRAVLGHQAMEGSGGRTTSTMTEYVPPSRLSLISCSVYRRSATLRLRCVRLSSSLWVWRTHRLRRHQRSLSARSFNHSALVSLMVVK